MPTKQAYSVKEAAEEFSVSEDTIRRAVNKGDLAPLSPHVDGKAVKVTVISHAEIWRWLTNSSRHAN